jgi:hypothetical protein
VSGLGLRPCTVSDAVLFCGRVHRRLPKVQGGMWAISVWTDDQMIGVAIVGHPARMLMGEALSVLRVAVVEGHKNACSMLYGACARAARAMGCRSLVTYTHLDEQGASLRAAGWITDGKTAGGEWNSPSRPRRPAIDTLPKHRWWAPWSIRLEQSQEELFV